MKGRRLPFGGGIRDESPDGEKTQREEPDASRRSNRASPPEQPVGLPASPSQTLSRDNPMESAKSLNGHVKTNETDDSSDPGSAGKSASTASATFGSSDFPRVEVISGASGNGTTKSKAVQDNGANSSRKRHLSRQPSLRAMNQDGSHTTVNILVDGSPYSPQRGDTIGPTGTALPLGHDGNQFYCQVCGGFGNVVCCDGCPRVYHEDCIPLEDPSRRSLENNDDPWFCPECMDKKHPAKQAVRRVETGDRRSSQHRCVDCHQNLPDLPLEPCEECGNYVHYPSCCMEADSSGRVFCSTCRAVDALTQEEDDLAEDSERLLSQRKLSRSMDVDEEEDESQQETSDESEAISQGRPKRKRLTVITSEEKDMQNRKPKKKRKKRNRSRAESFEEESPSLQVAVETPSPYTRRSSFGLAQATPAFYFYLAENRWKIERVLARKHRYFNRLPKGNERNELVAKEAALWWVKLRPTDHRRYMNMSMRDFESQIIEWKAEKNVRDMIDHEVGEEELEVVDDDIHDESVDDERLTYEHHERLYRGTSVGSKPFKPEPDESYNRVLLDLLHDMRFHPLPMFAASRSEADLVAEEHSSKITIPHFDVHGPISTSIGDECLGCSRGWAHFCSVLQRRIPSIEHRAKLQPPLSSLVATRVGLGLRRRLERTEESEEAENIDTMKNAELFAPREAPETKALRNLPFVPSSSLTDPSKRADDIIQFIEEAMYMKVPEPPMPDVPGAGHTSGVHGRSLPVHRRRDTSGDGPEGIQVNKCGRCRTIIMSDSGCVQCRRAQLVINLSKQQPSGSSIGTGRSPKNDKGDGKTLKVHTTMLGRVQTKEGSGESQFTGDQAVANAIVRMRWMPNTILPPQTTPIVPGSTVNSGIELLSEVSEQVNDDESIHDEVESEKEEQSGDSSDSAQNSDEVPDKQLRSARLVAAAAITDLRNAETDRLKAAELHRKQTSELVKQATSIACCGIVLGLMRRDPVLLFAEPVTAEGYSAIVKNPVDFGIIRSKVLAGKYQTLRAFTADASLLCENALAYNPPGSIYWKTAKELQEVLGVMQKRASHWIRTVKDAHEGFFLRKRRFDEEDDESSDVSKKDPFDELRKEWPEAVDMLEQGDWLRSQVEAEFMRTKENETAVYGSLAVRRVAAAAEASLAPYTDSGGIHSVVVKRDHLEDEALRRKVDETVSRLTHPIRLKDITSWREESVVRFMRKVQSRRLERRIISENGCVRCDGIMVDHEMKLALNDDGVHWGKGKKKGEHDVARVDPSRLDLTTGLASANTRERIDNRERASKASKEPNYNSVNEACVSVRGSKIHGWGLFADQPFKKGDAVAEYLGEYVVNPIADRREKVYQEKRIQDYQFRLDDKLVIDATMKGGHGRYINHNCSPNCFVKIIPGEAPNEHLKRVIIVAQRDIEINEEITYDYQFPLELNLEARIPCNCQSDSCRGFMNWDLPEKGSNNRALLVQKRGANMRDRIRRLGRPLKRDEA